MDIGILVTGAASLLAVCGGGLCLSPLRPGDNPSLRATLACSWIVTVVEQSLVANMAMVVFSMALLDLVIAGAALIIATHDRTRYDARLIGGLSMALMPAHWIMSASHGRPNWAAYAMGCNIVFILQCLIAGGWLNGVGRRIAGFINRVRPVLHFRNGG